MTLGRFFKVGVERRRERGGQEVEEEEKSEDSGRVGLSCGSGSVVGGGSATRLSPGGIK